MKKTVDEFAILQNRWWGQFLDASVEQEQSEMNLSLCAARRAAALAGLHDEGWSLAQIADAAQLSRERVGQLVSRDRRGRA